MASRFRYFHPFDVTYTEVSRRIRKYIDDLGSSGDAYWLQSIIWQFQIESDRWDEKQELAQYRDEMERMHLRILQLAAGAYLHICYDLPRVLADHWPGCSPYDPPNEERGEKIYDRIGTFFPEAINDVRRMSEVIGVFRPVFAWPESKRAMEVWVRLLRSEAWRHGRRLHSSVPSERSRLENAVLEAITEALSNVSARAPWHVLRLMPPVLRDQEEAVFYLASGPVVAAMVSNEARIAIEVGTLVVATLTLMLVLSQFLRQLFRRPKRKKVSEELDLDEVDELAADFIRDLGKQIRSRLSEIFDEPPPEFKKLGKPL